MVVSLSCCGFRSFLVCFTETCLEIVGIAYNVFLRRLGTCGSGLVNIGLMALLLGEIIRIGLHTSGHLFKLYKSDRKSVV